MYEQREQSCTFLGRLVRDTKANVIALTAAIIIPMIGLVGGAVDASRSYATKSRLQSACDAGALAGRRTMGSGLWAANSNRANSQAQSVFSLNFPSGSFGSQNSSAAFVESQGTVTGTATADVPMTLMKVFGVSTLTVNVTCTSMMVIPNTDVMFVLDTTGSMNCQTAHSGYTCPGGDNGGVEDSNAKIKGLRTAVKCFYEALSRVDTTEDCGSTPSGGLSSAVQLRFGFMPYATNVNVGKLLPTNYFADDWNYQSRTVNTTQVWTWSPGSTGNPGGWSGWSAAPSTYRTGSNYNSFSDVGGSYSPVTTTDGVTLARKLTGTSYDTSTECTNNGNPYGSHTTAGYTDVDGSPDSPVMTGPNTTPDYPETTQTMNFQQDVTNTVTYGYRYRWFKPSGQTANGCFLERATPKSAYSTYTISRTGTATRPLTWTAYQKASGYTYQQTSLDVSGLKAGSTSWNSSVALPLGTSSITVNQSGSTGSSSISIPANTTVSWNGCIEEAATARNTDGDPSDDWSPIPDTAYDADIDLVPSSSNPSTLWAPSLPNAVWLRPNSSYVYGPYSSTSNYNRPVASCPDEAHKLEQWSSASSFEAYVNGLSAGGSTYHDVGLIWGGRFMSPDGIFASENRTTPQGASIQRHMIFMTDGDTSTDNDIYDVHGVAWWDRRQTSTGSAPSTTLLNAVVNARFSAVCDAIKNKNIILWVVSYGGGSNSTTEARLSQCASPGRYYLATDTPTLIANFQDIANKISALRLTS